MTDSWENISTNFTKNEQTWRYVLTVSIRKALYRIQLGWFFTVGILKCFPHEFEVLFWRPVAYPSWLRIPCSISQVPSKKHMVYLKQFNWEWFNRSELREPDSNVWGIVIHLNNAKPEGEKEGPVLLESSERWNDGQPSTQDIQWENNQYFSSNPSYPACSSPIHFQLAELKWKPTTTITTTKQQPTWQYSP